MKPVHGDTVSNDGYSTTSCSYRSESGQATRNNLSRLFHENYIPFRESKLLEKLVKTRALYEELRNQLLTSSLSNSSNPDLNSENQQTIIEKDAEVAEKNNIIKLVDLLDKGVILRPKKLADSQNCNNYTSQLKYESKEHIRRKFHTRKYLISKSSIISKHRPEEESRLGIQFKTKNIKSDPCTSTFKYGEYIKRKSKELFKRIHREETKKFNRESTKKIFQKVKRSKPHHIKETKLSVSIQSSDDDIDTINSKSYWRSEEMDKFVTSKSSQIVEKECSIEEKKCSNNKLPQDYLIKTKHCIALEKMHAERKMLKKRYLNTPNIPKNVALTNTSLYPRIPKKDIRQYVIRSGQIKTSKANISLFPQEHNKLLKIMAALLPKVTRQKRTKPYTSSNITNSVAIELFNGTERKSAIKSEKLNLDLVEEKYKNDDKNFNSSHNDYSSNLNINSDLVSVWKNKIPYLPKRRKDGQEHFNFDTKIYDNIHKPMSKPAHNSKTDNEGECITNIKPPCTIHFHNLKINQCNLLVPCESIHNSQNINVTYNQNIESNKLSRSLHATPISSKIHQAGSVKRGMLNHMKLPQSYNKKQLKKSTSVTCASRSQHILSKKLRTRRYSSKLGTASFGNLITNPISITKRIVQSLDRINIVPKTYCCYKSRFYNPKKCVSLKKYGKIPKKCSKTSNDSRKLGYTGSYITQLFQSVKSKNNRSAIIYKTDVLIETKYLSSSSRQISSNGSRYTFKSRLSENKKPSIFSSDSLKKPQLYTNTTQSITLQNKHVRRITHKPKTIHSRKDKGWTFSPARDTCAYNGELHKTQNCIVKSNSISERTPLSFTHQNENQTPIKNLKDYLVTKTSAKNPNKLQIYETRYHVGEPRGFGIHKCVEKIKQNKTINIEIPKQEFQKKSESNTIPVKRGKLNVHHMKNSIHCYNLFKYSKPSKAAYKIQLNESQKSTQGQRYKKNGIGATNPKKLKSKYKVYKLMKRAIIKRTSLYNRRQKRDQRSQIILNPNKHTSSLRLSNNYEKAGSKLVTLNKLSKITPINKVSVTSLAQIKLDKSQKLFASKIMHQAHSNQLYDDMHSCSIISLSTVAFESKKSFLHKNQIAYFNSTDQSINIKSKETIEIKSKFSYEINFSKNFLSKIRHGRMTRSKKNPLVLGRRELRHLENNGTIVHPSKTVSPIQVNHELTGVSSLLKRCFCTMNLQVGGGRGIPKKIPYNLKYYECEPGVCVPYECDPYECKKLIMQRLIRQVSRMSGTENKSKSISTSSFQSNSKTNKLQQSSSRDRKRIVRTQPKGLTYQTLPRQPQSQMQSHRQATRVGSSLSFDIEFSKNRSTTGPVKETVTTSKPQSMSTLKKSADKNLKYRGHGTHKGANKRHRRSQAVMKKMTHKASSVTPMIKRCFCTLKFQKKGKQQKKKDFHTMGTSTPTKINIDEKQILRTRETGQTANIKKKAVLLPYECEPGICIPGECDPYECLERIKRRNQRSRGTASITSNISSSSMTPPTKKRTRQKYSQPKRVRTKPVRSVKNIVRSKPSIISTERLSTSSARQAVKLGSSFSFNVEFYKDRNKTSSTPALTEKRPIRDVVEKKPKTSKKPRKDKTTKIKKKKVKQISSEVSVKSDKNQTRAKQSKVLNAFIKRCFCTATLQKGKKKKLPKKNFESASTVTEKFTPSMRLEKPNKTQTRHRGGVLEPYECEPGVCVPGSCDPYECLKLIKKRHAKEKGLGTERHRTRSVSSSFTSSKTSKAGVAQSLLQTTPHEGVKQAEPAAPSESIIVREGSSQESTTRQAVRIGSTFSFDIEFYKKSQFPNYRRVQAASEAIRSTRRRMRKVSHGHNTKNRTTSHLSRYAQMEGANKADKALGPMLRRCFCSRQLQKKQKRRKPSAPLRQTKPRVEIRKPPRDQGAGIAFSKPVPDLHDRSVMTAYKLKTYPYKLDPYECEPGVCVPGECDPYECLERIKRRHMDRGSSTDNVETKSSYYMTKTGRRYRDNKNQYAPKQRKEMKVRKARSKDTKLEPRVETRTEVSSTSGSKQAVKIGSNFSFNVEFYKDRSHSGSTASPKVPTKSINYENPKRERVRRAVSKTSQGISVSTKQRKNQRRKVTHDVDSQVMGQKMRSTMTGIAPFLKRCFCTLQLQKRAPKVPKPSKRKPDLESMSVGTETSRYRPEIHSMHKGTRTRKKYKYHGRTLDPNECEPGVCIPGECDPYECLERIKRREMHSKQSNTRRYRSHSVSSSAFEHKKKPMRTQAHETKERKVKTKRTHDRPAKERVKERVTYEVSPTEQSHRQAVRIGSSFSFNIEFYKDRKGQVVSHTHDIEERSEAVKHTKRPVRTTPSGASRSSRSISSSYRRARLREYGMQSRLNTRSQGSGAGPLLKRCFCTLKLQKIGKNQILSNTQMQTRPASIETTYRHAGTRARKRRPEPKSIAAREIGIAPKRRRHALEPYECEPGVCIPGECDPYECLERIKRRNMRHSGTGMRNIHTRSMSSITSRTKPTKSMNTQMLRERRQRRKKPRTESYYKIKQPPRPSRALENININNRQAVRLGSDFAFNIEFYKDRSSVKNKSRPSVLVCSPSICKEPTCTPSKCKTSCTSKCSYRNQSTNDSPLRHHRRLQSHSARTESRGSSVRRLKRCFCTLTLQRAEVKSVMNSLRTTTPKIKTHDKSTTTKNKYFSSLLPYECEAGVCIPGECDPYECLERIKRRRGPYGPCDCLERQNAKIRRVSRTTETNLRRSIEIRGRQLKSGMSKKTQQIEPSKVRNIVEEPRFKLFNNPYTRNSVKISSNFSFNIEFTRDISFPSSTIDSDQISIEPQSNQADILKPKEIAPKVKRAIETQKPIAVKNEMTTTDLFRRCFCAKQLFSQIESVPEDNKANGSYLYRKCFCRKNIFSTKSKEEPPKIVKQEESSHINPLVKCRCKMQCSCKPVKCLCPLKKKTNCLCGPKTGKLKCLCPSKVTVARVEIEHLNPTLPNIERVNNKKNVLTHEFTGAGTPSKAYRSAELPKSKSDHCNCAVVPGQKVWTSNQLLKCFGTHKLFKTKSKQTNCKLKPSPLKKQSVSLKDKSFSDELPQRSYCTTKLLIAKSEQRRSKNVASILLARELKDETSISRMAMKLSSNLIKTNSDQRCSNIATTQSKSVDKTKHTSSSMVVPERHLSVRQAKKRVKHLRSNVNIRSSSTKSPLSFLKPKEYWVQYQIQYPRLHKRCHNRYKEKEIGDRKCNKIYYNTPSASVETIMSYSPRKFHNTKSRTLLYPCSSKEMTNEVRLVSLSNRKPLKKCYCRTEPDEIISHKCKPKENGLNKDFNQENIIYTSQKVIIEKNTLSVENILKSNRNSRTDFRKSICNCLRIFKTKKSKVTSKKCTSTQCQRRETNKGDFVVDISNKSCVKWRQNSPNNFQSASEQNIHKNKRVQCTESKKCDKKTKNIACNIEKKDKITNSRTVGFHNKITFCNNSNTRLTHCKSVNTQHSRNGCHDKMIYCQPQSSQCQENRSRDKIMFCKSQNSQYPKGTLCDKPTYKSQNSQCATTDLHDKLIYCNTENNKCVSANIHDNVLKSIKPQNSKCQTTGFADKITCYKSQISQRPNSSQHDKIAYCVPEIFQCPIRDCQDQILSREFLKSQGQHEVKVSKSHDKNKCNFFKNIFRSRYLFKKETKLIKVVKVTSDLKHLICSNNTVYKIKDVMPPGASGDYKFAFILESKGIQEDYKTFFVSDNSKKEKKPYVCIFYKRKDTQKKSKYQKKSCPCLVCRKIITPVKCSSDQKISCHLMEVCKMTKPKKTDLCHHCHNKTDIFEYNPHIKKRCKCGNKICDKEVMKVAKQHEIKLKQDLFTKRKCICGSVPCAAKLHKAKGEVRRLEMIKHQQIVNKYKKRDAKRVKMAKKKHKLKKKEAMRDTKNNSNGLLVIQSLLELKNLATESVKSVARVGCRAITEPKYTFRRFRTMLFHPKTAFTDIKMSYKQSTSREIFQRLRMRLGAISFVRKVKTVFESQANLNYLIHMNNKTRRRRPVPLKIPDEEGCKLYAATLRNKPCFWVYYLWPWFYPHCLNGMRMIKQLMDVILFTSAIVLWSPCLFGTELCRAILCCLFCTG